MFQSDLKGPNTSHHCPSFLLISRHSPSDTHTDYAEPHHLPTSSPDNPKPQFFHVLLYMLSPCLPFLPDKSPLTFQPPSYLTPFSFSLGKAANSLLGSCSTLCEPLTALLHFVVMVHLEASSLPWREETTCMVHFNISFNEHRFLHH